MARKVVFICPLCGRPTIHAELPVPRCHACRVRMEMCGDSKEFTRIQKLSATQRIALANSDAGFPRRK